MIETIEKTLGKKSVNEIWRSLRSATQGDENGLGGWDHYRYALGD
jgi:hypothetical protein